MRTLAFVCFILTKLHCASPQQLWLVQDGSLSLSDIRDEDTLELPTPSYHTQVHSVWLNDPEGSLLQNWIVQTRMNHLVGELRGERNLEQGWVQWSDWNWKWGAGHGKRNWMQFSLPFEKTWETWGELRSPPWIWNLGIGKQGDFASQFSHRGPKNSQWGIGWASHGAPSLGWMLVRLQGVNWKIHGAKPLQSPGMWTRFQGKHPLPQGGTLKHLFHWSSLDSNAVGPLKPGIYAQSLRMRSQSELHLPLGSAFLEIQHRLKWYGQDSTEWFTALAAVRENPKASIRLQTDAIRPPHQAPIPRIRIESRWLSFLGATQWRSNHHRPQWECAILHQSSKHRQKVELRLVSPPTKKATQLRLTASGLLGQRLQGELQSSLWNKPPFSPMGSLRLHLFI